MTRASKNAPEESLVDRIVSHLVGEEPAQCERAMAESVARCAIGITHEGGTPEASDRAAFETVLDFVALVVELEELRANMPEFGSQ